jgi:ubiquinone/menaquinone biosynthesis C-methylase UbiE
MSPSERGKFADLVSMLVRKQLTPPAARKFRAKFLKLLQRGLSDVDFVTALKNSFGSLHHLSEEQERQRESRRAQRRIGDLESLMPISKASTVLDVGCADGALLRSIGDRFGVPPERLIGIDVRPTTARGFVFHEADAAKVPLADASVDVITVMMAVHHFEDLAAVLSELHRVLRPGGVVVIREHDLPQCDGVCDNGFSHTFSHAFVDFAHILYSCIMNHRETPKEYLANYFVAYRGRDELKQLFADSGLVEDTATDIGPEDPFRPFYAVYKKAA